MKFCRRACLGPPSKNKIIVILSRQFEEDLALNALYYYH